MIETLCILVVGIAGVYLAALGISALLAPDKSSRFLLGFASTQTLHFVELLVRVIVAVSLIVAGPFLSPVTPFVVFGWILLGTSVLLLFMPWQWHQRFASSVVPVANRYIALIGIASFVCGVLILLAALRGFTP